MLTHRVTIYMFTCLHTLTRVHSSHISTYSRVHMLIHRLTCIHICSFTLAYLLTYSHMLIGSQMCTRSFTYMITHSNIQATTYACFVHSHMCNTHLHTGSHTHMLTDTDILLWVQPALKNSDHTWCIPNYCAHVPAQGDTI